MTLPTSPPTDQKSIAGIAPWLTPVTGNIVGWNQLISSDEIVPELTFPLSVPVYQRMANDTQCGALFRGLTGPIKRYRWYIDPGNDADPRKAALLAEDLGLPMADQDQPTRLRNRNRFTWGNHLHHVLLALRYGFAFFEQVGSMERSSVFGVKWRLRKLAPVMPDTIDQIKVADDGGLISVRQHGWMRPEMPVDYLVAYPFEKEGANWTGRSIFRECWPAWLIKDRLMRVDAVKHERNGMGFPVIEAPMNASKEQKEEAFRLTQLMRAGQMSGMVLPFGFKLTLQGVTGSLPDTLASIKYYDELMARNLMLMLMQLGQTHTGSRALGQEFADFLTMHMDSIAGWVRDISNDHIVEDWYDWNFGEQEPCARIKFERLDEPTLAASDFAVMVDKKIIRMDDVLEGWVRQRYGMPELDTSTIHKDPVPPALPPSGAPPLPGAVPPQADKAVAAQDAVRNWPKVPALRTPVRAAAYRRSLYEHEVLAAANFDAMDQSWQQRVDALVSDLFNQVRPDQVNELVEQIANAPNMKVLSNVTATSMGADMIEYHLMLAAHDGRDICLSEALAQGATIPTPGDVGSRLIQQRAVAIADFMAEQLSQSARSKALQLAPEGKGDATVAARVREHLDGLSSSWVRDQMGGAVTAAQNQGREAVFNERAPAELYASELLDTNTCVNCRSVDGKRYSTKEELVQDYPTGGYHACLGGSRCRGFAVAIWDVQ